MNPFAPSAPGLTETPEADGLLQQGLAASLAGDAAVALRLFAQASSAAPASGVPHFLSGSEYAALGEYDKAEAALANAVLLAPGFHIARYQLGLLQFSSGRAAAALVTWSPLLALDEGEALMHFVRGFAALAQDDFAAARNHFETGLSVNQGNPALSADIRKVLAGMAAAQSPQAPAAGKQDEDAQAASHVLVSNYGRFGTLH